MDAPKAPVQAEIQRPPSPKKEAPPAQEAPQIAPTQKTPPSVEKVAEQKDLLQQYIAIENEIREIQGKVNPNYKTLLSVAKESAERVKDLEKDYKKAQKRTKEEAEDVEKFYEKWGRHDGDNTALEKEKQEWLEAVGKEEALSKELEAMRALNDANQRALKQEKDDYELMQKKLQQQEDLIFKIFKGSYGSEAENKLEAEYDFLVEKEQRIAAAKYKWVNGRNLLQYATAQLSVACKKWASISTIPITNQPLRLMVVTESRNNSIAAAQNITAANQYLSTVQFPYCKPEEVKVLQTAAANVYIDSLTIERQQYVYANVYLSMFKRCKALVDWFSYVIEETIDKDLKQANKEVKEASFKLKQERCRCIAELVKTELNIDFVHQVKEEPVAPEVLVPVVDQSSQVVAPVPNSSEKSNEEDPPESEVAADQPFNPVPLKDLVQAPRKEELFGDVQELLKKHQEEIQELEKDNMVNRARQEQDLQEKLQARRNRRQRQAALGVEATPAGTPVHTAAA